MYLVSKSWDKVLGEEYKKDYFVKMMTYLQKEYQNKEIYPQKNYIFNALRITPYEKVKVIILGQDPYHGEGEAHGLSFSVQEGIKFPPSLQNIFKELKNDLNFDAPDTGDLTLWAKEGVLLLNSILTVEKDKAASHSKLGWETFTDEIIKQVNEKDTPVVFILWGNYARSKKALITNKKHFIIESVHPSPLSVSRGFFGSKPFSETNKFLKEHNLEEINWNLRR